MKTPLNPLGGARLRRFTTVALLLLALGAGLRTAWSADVNPPDRLTYQGFLADANGNPLATNSPVNYDVVFRIYSDQTGGALIWSEKQTVTVDKGQFSVLLGEGSVNASEARPALNTVFASGTASDRYLDLTVTVSGAPLNIAPRLRLVASPYAFHAKTSTALLSPSGSALVTAANSALTVAGSLTASGNVTGPNVGALGVLNPSFYLQDLNGSSAEIGLAGGAGAWSGSASAGDLVMRSKAGKALHLQASSGASAITINSANNVGFGYTAPTTKLQIFSDQAPENSSAGPIGAFSIRNAYGSTMVLGCQGGFPGEGWIQVRNAFLAGYTYPLALQPLGGGVGIGTTSPEATLDVRGVIYGRHLEARSPGAAHLDLSADGSDFNARISVYNSSTVYHQIGGIVPLTLTSDSATRVHYNLFVANGTVFAAAFANSSDARIKSVIGRSDSRTDLALVRKLKVTDYRFIDQQMHGDKVQKGLIAQDVLKVVPEAVLSNTNMFIPSIFADAQKVKFDAEAKTLSLTLAKPHELKVGDTVRFTAGKQELVRQELVVSAIPDARTFVVGSATNDMAHAFVYGRRVDDFLGVDYNRLFTTGLGAIQELATEVETLRNKTETRLAELDQKALRLEALEQKAARVDSLERDVAELKKLVARLAQNAGGKPAALAEPVSANASAKQ